MSEPEDPYDPRTRRWYDLAVEADGPVWTDPYIFFVAQRPGTTAAIALRDGAGELEAVVGIDVELDTLSRFLESTAAGLNGSVFVMNGSGEIIAHSSQSTVRRTGNGATSDLTFLRIDELDTAAGRLYAAGEAEHQRSIDAGEPTTVRVDSDEGTYLVGLKRMTDDNWPWIVGVEVREASFVTALTRNMWIGLVIALALGSIGSLFGYIIAREIGVPLAALRSNAQKVVDGEAVRLEPVRSRFREIQETSIALWHIMTRLKGEEKVDETGAEPTIERSDD